MQFLCQLLADLWKWAKDCVFRMLVRSDPDLISSSRLLSVGPACKYFGGQTTCQRRNNRCFESAFAYHFEFGMVVAILDWSARRITQARPSGDWPA
jgi:hypothetical protein